MTEVEAKYNELYFLATIVVPIEYKEQTRCTYTHSSQSMSPHENEIPNFHDYYKEHCISTTDANLLYKISNVSTYSGTQNKCHS